MSDNFTPYSIIFINANQLRIAVHFYTRPKKTGLKDYICKIMHPDLLPAILDIGSFVLEEVYSADTVKSVKVSMINTTGEVIDSPIEEDFCRYVYEEIVNKPPVAETLYAYLSEDGRTLEYFNPLDIN